MSIISIFDNSASSYDSRNQKLSYIKNNLHNLMEVVFSELPENANILCVGAGTGIEILYLAKVFPNFSFTAVDPSEKMLDIAKKNISEAGFIKRCTFHNGYLESLQTKTKYDGATSILVSQFILDEQARINFFKEIRNYLKNDGLLINVDLSSNKENYETLLKYWVALFNENKVSNEQVAKMKETYASSVGILPIKKVEEIIEKSGFKNVNLFFQSLLMHGWICKTLK